MKKSLFLCIPLFLMLTAAAGFAEKAEKAHPSKTTAAAQIKSVQAKQSEIQPAPVAPAAGEEINWQVISSGGREGSSTNFIVNGTVAQTAVGGGGSTLYGLTHGFWQSHGCCVGISGNADGDPTETCDISDLTKIIDYLFITGTPPDCLPEANTDGSLDGICDISDLTKVIDYLFISNTPPEPCL